MKQEHKLVAELYRYLAPFIDTEKDVFVSLDGQAAMVGVTSGVFSDSTIPDLWFTLVGAVNPTLVEAKTIDTNGRTLLMQSQLQAWRSNGTGAHKPVSWAATNREFNRFYYWAHSEFLPRLDGTEATGNTLTLLPPDTKKEFTSVNALALHLLRQA
jgi:hypothetical protein